MTRAETSERRSSPTHAWVDLLRVNCLTLQGPGAVNAVSASRAFVRSDEAAPDEVIQLAQRMAEEYGLLTEVGVRGYYLTVRFTRAPECTAETDTARRPSLVGRVRSFLRFKRGPAPTTRPEHDVEEAYS
jgi:hypothetical protein